MRQSNLLMLFDFSDLTLVHEQISDFHHSISIFKIEPTTQLSSLLQPLSGSLRLLLTHFILFYRSRNANKINCLIRHIKFTNIRNKE